MSYMICAVTSVPRPQAVRSRQAILAAARALIEEEGAASVTHQRVAERAGVGRATVYRHWPEAHSLLTAALEDSHLRFLEPGPGTLVERVRADLVRVGTELNDPQLVSLAATIVERARWDEATRKVRDRLIARVLDNTRVALEEAVANGELRAAPAPEDLMSQLIGPLWVTAMLRDAPVTTSLVESTLRAVLGPWLADAE